MTQPTAQQMLGYRLAAALKYQSVRTYLKNMGATDEQLDAWLNP